MRKQSLVTKRRNMPIGFDLLACIDSFRRMADRSGLNLTGSIFGNAPCAMEPRNPALD